MSCSWYVNATFVWPAQVTEVQSLEGLPSRIGVYQASTRLGSREISVFVYPVSCTQRMPNFAAHHSAETTPGGNNAPGAFRSLAQPTPGGAGRHSSAPCR